MDTPNRLGGWDIRHINDEVADLPPKGVDGTAAEAVGAVPVAIKHPGGRGARRGLDHGHAVGIPDNLGVVIPDDRIRHDVCAIGKVNKSRSGRRRRTFS
jgi:hypothetical protein